MPAAVNGTTRVITTIIGSLTVLAIGGGVAIGWAQSGMKENITANKEELERRAPAVAAIPVIQTEITHIKDDMKEMKVDIKTILQVVQAERN